MEKNKQGPTLDEFLRFKPKRSDFEWYTNEENLVRIKVPKFKGNFGKSFCRLIKKGDTFIANFDKLGSLVWKNCDGNNSVEQILKIIKKEYSGQEDLDQRLFLFLLQMRSLDYIDF